MNRFYVERGACGISWFGRRSRSWRHWHVGPWHVGWDVR